LAVEARDARHPLSIGLLGNAASLVPQLLANDAPIDIVTDQTSAHDPLSYLPVGVEFDEWHDYAQRKPDEFTEAAQAINGPAGNPECVWLGRRVVRLMWLDDLDTAFRHLDLYDRFGCPSCHIQATFRCLVLHGSNIDPKAADTLNGRVHACWINPTVQPAPAPAAAAPSPTTSR